MYQQFQIKMYRICPQLIYMSSMYLRTNRDLCHLQQKLLCFYNKQFTFQNTPVTIRGWFKK